MRLVASHLGPLVVREVDGVISRSLHEQGRREIRNLRDSGWRAEAPLSLKALDDLYERLLGDHTEPVPPHVDLLCLA